MLTTFIFKGGLCVHLPVERSSNVFIQRYSSYETWSRANSLVTISKRLHCSYMQGKFILCLKKRVHTHQYPYKGLLWIGLSRIQTSRERNIGNAFASWKGSKLSVCFPLCPIVCGSRSVSLDELAEWIRYQSKMQLTVFFCLVFLNCIFVSYFGSPLGRKTV